MNTDWTPVSLAAFERDIAETFNRGEIKSPVHLAGGNERQLIEIFKRVGDQDWICCAWRSHLHSLLRGVPAAEVKAAVIEGRSIALCFPEYRVISSALAGGIVPIALGLAWAAKRKPAARTVVTEKSVSVVRDNVWCFLGDMSAMTGIARECFRYAEGHELPLNIIVEDNGLSVATDTRDSWGLGSKQLELEVYEYEMTYPHVGTGLWVGLK